MLIDAIHLDLDVLYVIFFIRLVSQNGQTIVEPRHFHYIFSTDDTPTCNKPNDKFHKNINEIVIKILLSISEVPNKCSYFNK